MNNNLNLPQSLLNRLRDKDGSLERQPSGTTEDVGDTKIGFYIAPKPANQPSMLSYNKVDDVKKNNDNSQR